MGDTMQKVNIGNSINPRELIRLKRKNTIYISDKHKVDYDQKFDVLYYNISNTENSYGDEIGDNIVLLRDIDTDKITGITILGYKRMLEK